MKTANSQIEKKAIKFLGIMSDENVNWQEHMRTVANKVAKYIALFYRGKYILNESFLMCIYFAYIHLYLNYANIAWASTYRTKLKAIHLLQKRLAHIIFNENKIILSRPLL